MKSLILTLLLASAIQAQGIKPINYLKGLQFGHAGNVAVWVGGDDPRFEITGSQYRLWMKVTEVPDGCNWQKRYEIDDSVAVWANHCQRMAGVIYVPWGGVIGKWVDDPKLMTEWLWGID